jgi:3-hydroxyacyl-CoA dehydrogenase
MDASAIPLAVKTIAIIGAGPVGRDIALASILAGYPTFMEDVSRQSVDRAVKWIRQRLKERVGHAAALSLLQTSTRIEDAIRDAGLIIEAVPDELEMKLELFTIFDKFAKPGAIFASTSASLCVGDFADVTIFRERCIGMRFPAKESAETRDVIEVVRTPLTSDATVLACQEVALRLANEVIISNEASSEIAIRTSRPAT